MDPVTVVGLITAVIPFVTAGVKKIVHTEKLEDSKRKGINTLIPVIIGILSSGLYSYSVNGDWITALAVGLGSGGAASSMRDLEKNLIRIIEAVSSLAKK